MKANTFGRHDGWNGNGKSEIGEARVYSDFKIPQISHDTLIVPSTDSYLVPWCITLGSYRIRSTLTLAVIAIRLLSAECQWSSDSHLYTPRHVLEGLKPVENTVTWTQKWCVLYPVIEQITNYIQEWSEASDIRSSTHHILSDFTINTLIGFNVGNASCLPRWVHR